jgi:hypothetical protein
VRRRATYSAADEPSGGRVAVAAAGASSCRRGLADLGRVGFDDAGRAAAVLVALTHATLAIAAIPVDDGHYGRR